MVKTDKQVAPADSLPCPQCMHLAEYVGVTAIDADEEIWKDIYHCMHCGARFESTLALWCDPETGDFYAYESDQYRPAPGQARLL